MKALEHNKLFKSLCKSDQDKLVQLATEQLKHIAYDCFERESINIQEIWIKSALVLLGGVFNFTENQLFMFLQNWDHQYRWLAKFDNNKDRNKELDEELKLYFPNGFPQGFLDYLKEK